MFNTGICFSNGVGILSGRRGTKGALAHAYWPRQNIKISIENLKCKKGILYRLSQKEHHNLEKFISRQFRIIKV